MRTAKKESLFQNFGDSFPTLGIAGEILSYIPHNGYLFTIRP